MKGFKKRWKGMSAVFLSLVMLASLLNGICFIPVSAQASDTNDANEEEMASLDKLGFNTGKAQGGLDSTVSGGILPFGGSTKDEVQTTSMLTVSEVGIASAGYVVSPQGKEANQIINNLMPSSAATTNTPDLLVGAEYIGNGTDTIGIKGELGEQYPFGMEYISNMAFDGDGNGKADQLVQLAMLNKGTKEAPIYEIWLQSYNFSSEEKQWKIATSISIYDLPFDVRPLQAYGYLSMACGDYDGDAKDEVAVYLPNYYDGSDWSLRGEPVVFIYKMNEEGRLQKTETKFLVSKYCDTKVKKIDGAGHSDGYKKNLPVVNLETVSQPTDIYDDLIITASYPNDSAVLDEMYETEKDEVLNSHSTVGIIVDPLSEKMQSFKFPLRWNWKTDMGISSEGAADKYEIMRFASASAGNFDLDIATEVFVGGYRVKDSASGKYNLDEENYLYSTLKYNSTDRSYTLQKPSWIGVRAEYNTGASDMSGEAIGADYDDEDTVLSPMTIEAYAERGLGFPDSVFINGFVMGPESSDVSTYQQGVGMTYSSGYQGVENSYYGQNKPFSLRFAIPVEKFGIESGEQRGYMQAVAANFDGNEKGIESLLFTYAKNANVNGGIKPGKTEYRYVVGMVKNPHATDKVANISNKGIQGIDYSWMYPDAANSDDTKYYNNGCMGLSIYACDVDDDSMLVRPMKGADDKILTPKISFKDPQILAVLQAQPYFEELEYESSGGGTSFTVSETTGTTDGNSTSFETTVGIGFEFEVATGLTFGISEMVEYTFGREEEWETENSISFETGFGTDATDSVVLVMTPEITYFYEAWDSTDGQWKPMNIVVPQASQTSQISVDRYDYVAKASGWSTIRGNILHNEAGNPASYAKSAIGLKDFIAAKVMVGNNEFLTTGSGSGQESSSIGVEKNESHSTSYSNSGGSETEATVASVKGKFAIGGGHTESSGTFETNGSTYSGEVADLPDDDFVFDNYKFDWLFGYWTGELDGCTFPVLGYLVKNVSQAPMKPQALNVDKVTKDEVTLSWQSDYTTGFFTVESYIKSADAYLKAATVAAEECEDGRYQCVIEELEPDSDYSFRVIYHLIDGIKYKSSLPTECVNAHTIAEDSIIPVIDEQPGNVTADAGNDATFSVSVSSKSNSIIYYTWQKYTQNGWQDIIGATGKDLKLSKVSIEQNESMYRCRVIQRGITIYTELSVLYVNRKAPVVAVEANAAELYASVTLDDSPVGGDFTVLFEAVNLDTGYSQTYSAKTGADGSAQTGWVPDEAGKYKIIARFLENNIYDAAEGTAELFVPSENRILSLGGESNLVYGDTLTMMPKLYEVNGTTGTDVEPDYNIYSITDSKAKLIASSKEENVIGDVTEIVGNTYKPTTASVYKVEATYDGLKAIKMFTVDKKDVTVKAEVAEGVPVVSVTGATGVTGAGISDSQVIKDSYEIKADGYDTIPDAPGVYTLYPKLKDGEAVSEDYLEKYSIIEESTVYKKAVQKYNVEVLHTEGGRVNGTFALSSDKTKTEFVIPKDNMVMQSAKVTISARPEKGYKLSKWIVDGTELVMDGESYVTDDSYVIDSLTKDTDISVVFEKDNLRTADYSKVDEAIGTVPEDLSLYTELTVQKLQMAIDSVVRGKDISEQDIVDGYARDIELAIKELEYKKADYTEVNRVLESAPENLDAYEVKTVLKYLMERMNVVYDLPITKQDIVDSYVPKLEEAIAGLKKIGSGQTPSGGNPGQTPSGGDSGQTPSGGNLGQTPSGGDPGQTPSGGDPKPADEPQDTKPSDEQHDTKPEDDKSETDSDENNKDNTGDVKGNELYVGLEFVYKNNKYLITKYSDKVKEVQFTGVVKAKKKVTVPNTITYSNTSFKVTSIGKKAFYKNKTITTLSIGNNVKKIEASAFCNAGRLKKITIGTGLVSIGKHAFCSIADGSVITIKSKKLKSVALRQNHSSENRVMKVPKSKIKAYKKLFKLDKDIKIEEL